MKAMKFLSIVCGLLALALVACVAEQNSDGQKKAEENKISTKKSALKIDPATGLAQECTPVTGDNDCNAEGPTGQKLFCGADKKCYFSTSDEGCTYPEFGGGTKTCVYTACSSDNECTIANPDPNLVPVCIFTVQSNKSDEGGECAWFYKKCAAAAGTPCEVAGYQVCANNQCTCTASANLSKAVTENCDNVDNDCDGKTDEDFALGEVCDGADSDQCKNGTLQCAKSGLATECVNETLTDIAELCDGKDNDCDGKTDEDFPTLGQSCDGDDADSCKNGQIVCSLDQKGVACSESGKNVDEGCNGLDDNCDGKTDEGCDDDADGFCDAQMGYVQGAACKASDCNDAEKSVNPDASELCDSVDNNCNGKTDEGFSLGEACFDGVGVCKVVGTFNKCAADGKSSVCSAQADLSKSVTEICDGVDNNCDGKTDEGCDDDKDGYCDASMTVATGATCKVGDCDDAVASIYKDATEICNGVDDNCDGKTDEGCDDDKDGWCDASMTVATGAACKAGDCDDEKAAVHPGVEEVCATAYDDNCDGKTDVKADLKTPACDACSSVKKIECGKEVEIDMSSEPQAFNAIETYECWTSVGAKQLKTTFSAPEVVVAPDAPAGTKFSLQITTTGLGVLAARLHGSCQPNTGTKAVTAFNEAAKLSGTCAQYGTLSVSGGVVGADNVVLDAAGAKKVKIKFTCVVP